MCSQIYSGLSEALCKRFPLGVVSFFVFSALKKENARRTEWQTGPWPLAILQVSAIAGPHF
jgi:hypothetical protein